LTNNNITDDGIKKISDECIITLPLKTLIIGYHDNRDIVQINEKLHDCDIEQIRMRYIYIQINDIYILYI
jgi:hypothetical protein